MFEFEYEVTLGKTEGFLKFLLYIFLISCCSKCGYEVLSDRRIEYSWILSEISYVWIVRLQCCLIKLVPEY